MSSMRVGMRYLEPVTPPDTLAEAQERVVVRAQRAVLAAQKTIDAAVLDRVIDAPARSRMIYAFGSGGVSSRVVELCRLGLRITSRSDHQMQRMMATTVERGDVVFVSSLSGNNAEVIKAACIAADYGATTVALTVHDTPLVKAVALALTIDITDDGDVLGPTCLRLRLPRRRRHVGLWRRYPKSRSRTGRAEAHPAAVHDLPGHR
jgi:DNA-binding MurR/RpiR family transcriptional regulator